MLHFFNDQAKGNYSSPDFMRKCMMCAYWTPTVLNKLYKYFQHPILEMECSYIWEQSEQRIEWAQQQAAKPSVGVATQTMDQ